MVRLRKSARELLQFRLGAALKTKCSADPGPGGFPFLALKQFRPRIAPAIALGDKDIPPPQGILETLDHAEGVRTTASQARYQDMALVSEEFVKRKLSAPHTWHAAEVFLYLLELK